ncbi:MAG: hypothetical protein KAR42_14395 [candidate division Zixibacteria bacterium]|nr:hypothetical protein [candidate division Zixibacteria bacterium]
MPRQNVLKYKIGVIGSINRDTIYQVDGNKIESWGGALYNLAYMNKNNALKIYPVANIGRDSYKQIIKIVQSMKNISTEHLKKVSEPNNHCFLHYHNQSHKCEILKGGVPQIKYNQVKPLLDCDAILVNFISGRDIKLPALEKLRANYTGMIYMDIHSLWSFLPIN